MAAGTMPAPGTEYGPCEEPCQHRDCASTRALAADPCRICGDPIGYETPFFRDDDDEPDGSQRFVHALCLLLGEEEA